MSPPASPTSRRAVTLASRWASRLTPLGLCALLLSACGGGGSGGTADSGECSTLAQKQYARSVFEADYFWAGSSPLPPPESVAGLQDYVDALRFRGNDSFPADRYSFLESAAAFSAFYGEGRSLAFGVAVAGQEVKGRPEQPLWVRDVEPQSPAGQAGVVRGEQVLSINGKSSAEVIAADDFSALTANTPGQRLSLELKGPAGVRTVNLVAADFDLTPVRDAQLLSTPGGRRVGHLRVNAMIPKASGQWASAFQQFKQAGVEAVVLDLRYNGGGQVSVGADLASALAGAPAQGQTYARLVQNAQRSSLNSSFRFTDPVNWTGVPRVVVLAGPRTCSASEQVVMGLRGVGIEAITVGATTCGKPVGFNPSTFCSLTYNIVTFESLNARNEGRYFNGLAAQCPVAEDFQAPLGQTTEPLLRTALARLDGQACASAAEAPAQARRVKPGASPLQQVWQ